MKKLAVLLLLAGCSTAPRSPALEQRPADPAAKVEVPPQEPALIQELLRGRTAEEQSQIMTSDGHYRVALAWFNKGDFDKAKEQARRAVQIWPENLAARKLLDEIHGIIVGGPTGLRTASDIETRTSLVRVEQAQIEITNHMVHGERYLNAKMYESALREFENAEFKIIHLPYDVKSMNELLPKVKELKVRARSSIKD